MTNALIKIESATPVSGHRVAIQFSDGVSGALDLSDLVKRGVFRGLAPAGKFSKLRVAGNGRAVEWPGNLDLCADALYERLTGRLPWQTKTARTKRRPPSVRGSSKSGSPLSRG